MKCLIKTGSPIIKVMLKNACPSPTHCVEKLRILCIYNDLDALRGGGGRGDIGFLPENLEPHKQRFG